MHSVHFSSPKGVFSNKQLAEADESRNMVGMIDAQHDIDVINVKISGFKEAAHVAREGLRYILFRAVPQADGALLFYPEEELPQGSQTDGRKWHIKIGNAGLGYHANLATTYLFGDNLGVGGRLFYGARIRLYRTAR